MHVRESEGSVTKDQAPRGTERHRDQAGDQAGDQVTKTSVTKVRDLAGELLEQVARGSDESVRAAELLVQAVLEQPIVHRAVLLRELLKERSPLAMVRAVELAELLLRAVGEAHGVARDG